MKKDVAAVNTQQAVEMAPLRKSGAFCLKVRESNLEVIAIFCK